MGKVMLEIYREQMRKHVDKYPFNYLPDDIIYRLPIEAGPPEPPVEYTYPVKYRTRTGKIALDPLTVFIGTLESGQPFAINPRYIVNPLVLVVGTPGAGKSLHPDEQVLVVGEEGVEAKPIKEVTPQDRVFSVDARGRVSITDVIAVIRHEHRGPLYRVRFRGEREGEVLVTPDHSLLLINNDRIVPVRGDRVRPGDMVPVLATASTVAPARVVEVETVPYEGPVYDIETVDGTFMLANGLFVHNSATLKTFIYNLLHNEAFGKVPPIIVVDPEGEYHVVGKLVDPSATLHLKLGRRDYINIFDRPSKTIDPFAWYMRMMSVVQKFLHISESQAGQAYRVLKKAIREVAKSKGITEDPATWYREDITLRDIHHYLENRIQTLESKGKMRASERREYQGAVTLYSRLDAWMYPPNDAFSNPSTVDLAKVLRYKLIVLDARGLSSTLFGLFTYWIVYWFYGLLLEKGPLPEFGIRYVLLIDEAWALLKKEERKQEENPLESLARRGRKYGIWIWVATQTPEDVDEKMFSLFGTLATGSIPSDKMVEKIVKSRGMPKSYANIIKSLKRGKLVWSINWADKDFPMSRMPLVVYTAYPIRGLVTVA